MPGNKELKQYEINSVNAHEKTQEISHMLDDGCLSFQGSKISSYNVDFVLILLTQLKFSVVAFSNVSINEEDITKQKKILEKIFIKLKDNSDIEEFIFSNSDIAKNHIDFIVNLLDRKSPIKAIYLSNNSLTVKNLYTFIQKVADTNNLEELYLPNNKLSDKTFKLLNKLNSKNCTSLKKIHLSSNKINLNDFSMLNSLKSNASLEDVCLSNNECNKLIATNIKSNKKIFTELFKLVSLNQNITNLDISGCSIDLDFFRVLSLSLQYNSTLKDLDLSDNESLLTSQYKYSDKEFDSFFDFISKNKSIEKLNLSNCKIDSFFGKKIVENLEKNFTIIDLDIQDDDYGKNECSDYITTLLGFNKFTKDKNKHFCSNASKIFKVECIDMLDKLHSKYLNTNDSNKFGKNNTYISGSEKLKNIRNIKFNFE